MKGERNIQIIPKIINNSNKNTSFPMVLLLFSRGFLWFHNDSAWFFRGELKNDLKNFEPGCVMQEGGGGGGWSPGALALKENHRKTMGELVF